MRPEGELALLKAVKTWRTQSIRRQRLKIDTWWKSIISAVIWILVSYWTLPNMLSWFRLRNKSWTAASLRSRSFYLVLTYLMFRVWVSAVDILFLGSYFWGDNSFYLFSLILFCATVGDTYYWKRYSYGLILKFVIFFELSFLLEWLSYCAYS